MKSAMKFSNRMTLFQPSATLAVNAKTLELKAKGIPVTSLAVGEPDFPTPAHICHSAKNAIDADFSKYTAVEGIAELRQAVCMYFYRQYAVSAAAQNIIVTNGGKQSLYEVFLAMLNAGDEVMIPVPYWTSYPDMVLLAGGTPCYVPTKVEAGFRLSVADLERAKNPRCKMLILNSPSNPTGVTYTQAELDALLHWAYDNHIFVLSDEIYDQLVYPPAKAASAANWWEKHPEAVAVANGLAKAFAMTGWRVGYTLAHQDLIKEMSKIQGQMTSNVCSIAQKAATTALAESYDCVNAMRDAFMRRRDLAHAELATWPGVICPKPEGAFYLFPDISALFTPEMPHASALCTHLLEKAQVAVMPGEAFGDPKCIRFSYAVSDETLMSALTRIKAVLYS